MLALLCIIILIIINNNNIIIIIIIIILERRVAALANLSVEQVAASEDLQVVHYSGIASIIIYHYCY